MAREVKKMADLWSREPMSSGLGSDNFETPLYDEIPVTLDVFQYLFFNEKKKKKRFNNL